LHVAGFSLITDQLFLFLFSLYNSHCTQDQAKETGIRYLVKHNSRKKSDWAVFVGLFGHNCIQIDADGKVLMLIMY
jgi:hypothetical protein